MPPSDPTQSYLRSRKSPPDIIAGGLPGLIDRWAYTVSQITTCYPLTFDDYLNDMDIRQLIEETLPHATIRAHKQATSKLYTLDTQAQLHLTPTKTCLWGTQTAIKNNWTPEHHWWYYNRPTATTSEFLKDFATDSM